MADISPFAAWRFNTAQFGPDLSRFLSPPYDVLDANDKSRLLERDARNIVAVDLPHVPPSSPGPAEAYQRSAETLNAWMRDATLVREAMPSLYVYHQAFEHAGRSFTRKMFIARVKLAHFSEGVILPHEKTFGGPKEDRLALMKATTCNLSPIFGLYTDTAGTVDKLLGGALSPEPDAFGHLDGVDNRLWVVSNDTVLRSVADAMREKKIYIADGHHRYTTSLMYRDGAREKNNGALPSDHPANYVMFVLARMEDPGCLILPYHRALGGVDADMLMRAWKSAVEPVGPGACDLRIWNSRTNREFPARYTNRSLLPSLAPDECPAWHRLDYAYLHRYLIDELLAPGKGTKSPDLHYAKSEQQAKEVAKKHAGVALLVNATPMDHLRAVSESGGLMPQKSTYFHPKLATGLTIHPLI